MANTPSIKKLPTESYKGVRDFYPADMFVQNYIFTTWKETIQKYGYEEYTASILENTDIYRAKSGQELINEQTYTFTDRGDREVTLRPEMTPSLARMVAAQKRELGFPLRLFSIPNCFRYERPQRGRMREFWQCNVDLLTKKPSPEYVVEILRLLNSMMIAFGAHQSDFVIRVNSRRLMSALYTKYYGFTEEQGLAFSKIIDKKDKVSEEHFTQAVRELTDKPLVTTGTVQNITEVASEFEALRHIIQKTNLPHVVFDLDTIRGLDYYTDIVFEVFDTNPENNRALFGGGQYDGLVDLFEGPVDEPISGIGFAIGDVPMLNFLESRNLIPTYTPSTDILIAVLDEDSETYAYTDVVAEELRALGKKVAVQYTARKYQDQAKLAQKLSIPSLIAIGQTEAKEKTYEIKSV